MEENEFKDLGKDIWVRLLQETARSSYIDGSKSQLEKN
jgi:hypothetical protein